MSKKRIFIYLWVVILLAGVLSALWLGLMGRSPGEAWDMLLRHSFPLMPTVAGHADTRTYHRSFALNPLAPYIVLSLAALCFSLLRWIRNPCPRTWLWTVFCGWGMCGVPGMMFIALVQCLMIGGISESRLSLCDAILN